MRQDTREQIFEFLQDYQRQNGFAPTVREICAGVGLRSPSTVHYHLNALRQAGRIGGQTERARAITLPTARSGQVPVVGTVTAGQPILAVEQIEGYLLGNQCGMKGTSCADQLAKCVRQAYEQSK